MSNEQHPTDCQTGEKILRAAILKAASRHITSGRHRLNQSRPLPSDITDMMTERDDLRSRDLTSLVLQQTNDEIKTATIKHKQEPWRKFAESLDHRTDSTILWQTIKTIDERSQPNAENESIVFSGSPSIFTKADRKPILQTIHHINAGRTLFHP